jgi:hypothetical protein
MTQQIDPASLAGILRNRPAITLEELALKSVALPGEEYLSAAIEKRQLPDGGWSEHAAVPLPNAYSTGLALLSLARSRKARATSVENGFQWLAKTVGVESHWLWKWKFRFFDTKVRFDPSKSGWPWIPGTLSWVAPTAISLLAHEAWGRTSPRTANAREMLLDRCCKGGGWNAGNAEAFGVALTPHPDFTAMAVMALHHERLSHAALLASALDYLWRCLSRTSSVYSLSLGVIALRAYSDPRAARLNQRLAGAVVKVLPNLATRELALAKIAIGSAGYGASNP